MHFLYTYCIFYSAVSYASAQENKTSYEGAQLWHTEMRSVAEIVLVKKLIDDQDVSAWKLSPTEADFLVRADNIVNVQKKLMDRNLSYTVHMPNVQHSVDMQMEEPALWNENTLRIGHRLNWRSYPPLHIINEYYNYLSEDYSSLCKIRSIGHTLEKRTITMINITNGNPKNKIIIITGGVHAREWVSVTSALYIVHTIVTKFDQQSDYVKSKNWLIIPLVNPDGYQFSHTYNRLWRKNRRKFVECRGADINRNFNVDWGVTGITENNECREAYAGPHPFSELETMALRGFLLRVRRKVSAVVDLHAYGNMILYPWSARSQHSFHRKLHNFTAEGMIRAMLHATGQKYSHGPTYHKIYPATGAFIDWAYSQGVKHAYAIEGRDTGKFGFLLPPKYIENTGRELYAAVKFLAKTVDPPIQHRNNDYGTWF